MSNDIDPREDEHPTPYLNLFSRLSQHLPEYVFDGTHLFHSSYDNWHVMGHSNIHVVARVTQNDLRIEREFKQAQLLAHDNDYLEHFVRPIQLVRMPAQRPGEVNLVVSIIEAPSLNYIEEISLLKVPPKNSDRSLPSLAKFLDLAIGCCSCLEVLHYRRDQIHGEIRMDAFHYNLETGAVRLINLGSGVRSFTDRLTSTGWTNLLSERGVRYKLQFFAPEQTGRLAAEPDKRTDVYALGVGFWSYLAGIMPYNQSDPLEIIQSVLSQKLRPIRAIRPDIPQPIAMIITKMTKKALSERYSSVSSVKHDMQQIKNMLAAEDITALENFKIAQNDVSASFVIPTTLIGREEEAKIVMESVDSSLEAMQSQCAEDVKSTETPTTQRSRQSSSAIGTSTYIISISGECGVGKTFFMRSMQQNIRQKVLVVSAQFEKTKTQPLDPILKLISAIFRQLFSESDVDSTIHKAIRQQVGPYWLSICEHLDLPPWLLDTDHSSTASHDEQRRTWLDCVGSTQTGRFMQVLLQVLRVIAYQKALYLCLDDLDLADAESLDLVQALISANLPLILAIIHNPKRTCKQLDTLVAPATKIELNPFTEEETARYIRATIGPHDSLASIVYDRTGGLPSFVKDFLERCHNSGHIAFSWQDRQWKIQLEKVAQCWPATKDPQTLVEKPIFVRFQKLPEDVRTLLCWATVAGKRFAFSNLQDVLKEQDTLNSLQIAVSKFIIRPTDQEDIFEFSDKNTYSACCMLADAHDLPKMHLALARSMLSKRNLRVYDIAEHITNCLDIIDHPKQQYINVLLEAADKARTTGSLRRSASFCDAAMRLIDGDAWSSEHLQLYIHAAEVYQVVDRVEESLKLLDIIEDKIDKLLDKVPTLVIRSRIYGAQGDGRAAFETIKTALTELDSSLIPPDIEDCDQIFREDLNLQGPAVSATAQPGLETLLSEAVMTSLFMSDIIPYQSAIGLVKQCDSGNSGAHRAIGLVYLSAIALFRLSDTESSQALRKDAMVILDNTQTPYDVWSRALVLRTFLLGHQEVEDNVHINRLTTSLEDSTSTSDRAFLLLNISAIALLRLMASHNLEDLENFIEHSTLELSDWTSDLQNSLIIICVRQLTRAMRGKTRTTSADTVLCDDEHDTKTFLQSLQKQPFCYSIYRGFQTVALNMFGFAKEAMEIGLTLTSYVNECRFSPCFAIAYYHLALAIATVLRDEQTRNHDLLNTFQRLRERLELLVTCETPVYRARVLVLDAEICNDTTSLKSFNSALEIIMGHNFELEEAFCLELYIRCLIRMGATNAIHEMTHRCATIYENAGAAAKAKQVMQLLPHGDVSKKIKPIERQAYNIQDSKERDVPSASEDTQSWIDEIGHHDTRIAPDQASHYAIGTLDVIDLHSIICSSQAMTSELQIDRLSQTLTKIIAESTAAEVCSIVIEDEDEHGWIVAATQPDSEHKQTVLEDLEDVARQVNTYVLRFREQIFIHNTQESELFANIFPHIAEELSVICMPMLHSGTLLGSLYCQAPPNTFTDRTLTLVQLLVTQISISLHNAILFKRLEKVSNNNFSMIELQKDTVKCAQESEKKARLAETEAVDNLKQKEEAMKAKSLFLANVSHELRTPLNGVIGMTTILQDTQLTAHQRECSHNIRVCAETLVQIVNDILDYNKLDAGKMMVSNAPMNIHQTLSEVITTLRATHAKEDIETIEDLNLDKSTMIIGDSIRLQQVLMNLMSNAYKFTPKGKIIVSASTKRKADIVKVTISVADSGIGISPEQQHKLFQPFSQADASTARSYGGTGLGLSICKLIVESVLKGEIWLDSVQGEGTTVTFSAEYKLADVDAAQTVHRPAAAYAEVRKSLRLKPSDIKICIAEDNAINRKIAMSYVKKLGYKYEAYADGKQAVDALVQAKDFHLVLMDVQMPVLDGYDATRAIRQREDVRDVIIIAMTASSIQGDKERCFQAGMDAYVAKPVRLETLRDAIQSFIAGADEAG